MYLCCLLPYVIYFPTVMARYSLFVLKVPLNPKQTNKQTYQTVDYTVKSVINAQLETGKVHNYMYTMSQ